MNDSAIYSRYCATKRVHDNVLGAYSYEQDAYDRLSVGWYYVTATALGIAF